MEIHTSAGIGSNFPSCFEKQLEAHMWVLTEEASVTFYSTVKREKMDTRNTFKYDVVQFYNTERKWAS